MFPLLVNQATQDPANITLVAQAMSDQNFDWLAFESSLFTYSTRERETIKVALEHVQKVEQVLAIPLVLTSFSTHETFIPLVAPGPKGLLRLSRALGLPISQASFHLAESLQCDPLCHSTEMPKIEIKTQPNVTQFTALILRVVVKNSSYPQNIRLSPASWTGIEEAVAAYLPPQVTYVLTGHDALPVLQAAWVAHNLRNLEIILKYYQQHSLEEPCRLRISDKLEITINVPYEGSLCFAFSWLAQEEELVDMVYTFLQRYDIEIFQ